MSGGLRGCRRERFGLDPRRRIGALSRGEHMKAALLCALAPRPRLLIMDEPFTGMDLVVKDDLVRGLLASASSEGWTVVMASHDIGELELLADWVGLLTRGRLDMSEPMDQLTNRFKRVSVLLEDVADGAPRPEDEWLAPAHAQRRLSFFMANAGPDHEAILRARFPHAALIEVRSATLSEIFLALARRTTPDQLAAVAA
jgi:ABC-2 type transport system ATP-binding protein